MALLFGAFGSVRSLVVFLFLSSVIVSHQRDMRPRIIDDALWLAVKDRILRYRRLRSWRLAAVGAVGSGW